MRRSELFFADASCTGEMLFRFEPGDRTADTSEPGGRAALCAPLVELDMPCSDDSACGNDARCRGTCRHAGTEGEDCDADCRLDLSCIDGKCVTPPFANGSVCIGYSYGP